jgi:hypothetical protein
MKHPARTSVQVSESLHHRLNAYALVASTAGVGVLALANHAEAKIVYTSAHHVIRPHTRYQLDLNHDGIGDFTFVDKYGCNFDYCYGSLAANPAAGNGVEGFEGLSGFLSAYALKRGSQIGPKHPFSGQLMAGAGMGTIGKWANVTNRYLGLRFQVNGQTHYGWARLNVSVTNSATITATLTGDAYETIPNKPIIAGQTHGKDEGTLGRLAQGAAGIAVRWQER